MSAEDIMKYIDKQDGIFISLRELEKRFMKKLTRSSIIKSLKSILKMDEYCAVLINEKYTLRSYYGRKPTWMKKKKQS
jgi:hypothetical protein